MTAAAFYTPDSPDIAVFRAETAQRLAPSAAPHAAAVENNIPIYDGPAIAPLLASPDTRRAVQAEWAHVLGHLSGVIIIRQAQPDTGPIDRATTVFEAIIAAEKAGSGGGGDHFATAGANDRIWNSLQKLALADPETFAAYHAAPAIDAVCEAWLGPNYQMTAQVNLVRPGGRPQTAHRDYHLGFMSPAEATGYPVAVHHLSPYLTLQGGLAHVDMPIETGPTRLMPFSQLHGPGYLAYERPDFRALFEERAVQLPLAKGDALFFNPALFHGAGENRSEGIQRLANLFQVSSAFGRAMETVDRMAMCKAVYTALRRLVAEGRLNPQQARATIAATAEGYSFPTNLDTDPPVAGLAPETQAGLFTRALETAMAEADFAAALDAQAARRTA